MGKRKKPAHSFSFDLYKWLLMWIPRERGGKLIYGYRRHVVEPSPHLTYALHEALKIILEEGLENRIRRNRIAGKAVREGVKALGLELYPLDESYASNTVTGVIPPGNVKPSQILEIMRRDHGIILADGLEETYEKVVRIAHMGLTSKPMYILETMSALEAALRKLGLNPERGAGVEAAAKVFSR